MSIIYHYCPVKGKMNQTDHIPCQHENKQNGLYKIKEWEFYLDLMIWCTAPAIAEMTFWNQLVYIISYVKFIMFQMCMVICFVWNNMAIDDHKTIHLYIFLNALFI